MPLKVYVPVVDNLSARHGLEAALTSRLRERLVQLGQYRLVQSPDQAERVLLVQISQWSRRPGPTLITGDASSAGRGGLASRQVIAGDFVMNLEVQAEFVEKLPGLNRQVWRKSFSRSQIFEASRRFEDPATSAQASLVNQSREEIQSRQLVDAIVQLIEDNL